MYTYLFITDYLNKEIINQLFEKRYNWKLYQNENIINFLFMDGKSAYLYRKYWTIQKTIFNMIDYDKESIINKNYLYQLLNKNYPKICQKYMMKQIIFNTNKIQNYKNLFNDGKIWILKPIDSYGGGKGIIIIPNYKFLLNIIHDIKKSKFNQYVLSQYIIDPLLFNNKKFHLRMFYMYNPISKTGYLLKYGFIYTAANNYLQNKFYNKNIHDTHFESTNNDYYFPHEFINIYPKNKIFYIYQQLIELFHYIKFISDAKCYQESKICFQIFGADIMITKDFKIKLLEINDKIGIETYDNIKITEYLVEGVLETIVDPLLPPKNKQIKKNYFIKL